MFAIDKENVEKYRYAVGKAAFLKSYGNYSCVQNFKDSNCMVVSADNGETKIVSLFGAPMNRTAYDGVIEIWYQSPQYKRYGVRAEKPAQKSSSEENGLIKTDYVVKTMELGKEFDALYSRYIVLALTEPNVMLNEMEEKYRSFFEELLMDFGTSKSVDGNCYKYFGQSKVSTNRYNVNDGEITFSNPNTFNDPFDCNCAFANNADMSSRFRVFCVTPEYKNILMWSYYADNHSGYCFEYNKQDILKEVLSSSINGICIIGKVDYRKERPEQKSKVNKLSYSDLMFYINASFTKYIEWKHEREYRYVIISSDFENKGDFLSFKVNVENIYEGCKGDDAIEVKNSNGKAATVKKLIKDEKEYKLVERPEQTGR